MKVPHAAGILVGVGLILLGCGRQERLDTRTFELKHLDDDVAATLIDPYVYADRPDAPGAVSAVRGGLTVRETPDNLSKIARVLGDFDRPSRSVTLHFQMISANGNAQSDPQIAEVEEELRKLFRFSGYQLLAGTAITGLEHSFVQQRMFVQQGRTGDFSDFIVYATIGSAGGEGDSAVVDLEIELQGHQQPLLAASVSLNVGHTVVLGTLPLASDEALVLTVKAEIQEGRGR
jgi:hypothetical protein